MRFRSISFFTFCLSAWLMPSLFAQQPVLHLMMDEEGSSYVSDQTSKKNHANLFGGLEFVPDRFGNDCRAIKFDGYSGYLSVPHRKNLNLSSRFTVSTWVKLPGNQRSQGLQWLTLVCKGENPDETDYSPAFRAQLTSVTASVNTASTKSIGSIRQGFPANRWFHTAMVYDGNQLTIYESGQEIGRYMLQDPIYANQEPLNIGRDIPGNLEYFSGEMDDLKLFDKALSAKEISALAKDDSYRKLGSACPRPVQESPEVPQPPVVAPAPAPSQPTPTPPRIRTQPQPQPQVQPAQPTQPQATPPRIRTQPAPAIAARTNGKIPTQEVRLPKSPKIQKKKKIEHSSVTIFLYDHRAIDHDTVDVYLDGLLILQKYEIQAFKHGDTFEVPLQFSAENREHVIAVVAKNYGTAGTKENTIGIRMHAGGDEIFRDEIIVRKLEKAVGMRLIYTGL